ncbi:ribosome quality control complex subunit NEMF-like isoform X1 [Branchiostoma lanceolatum]|uniref:ribosome quality control complex subunit NEMF-like isoform X1 n=1 Tax=Branchiostoma lanceolatum TaxID=7740 RepID=UPI003454BE91
MKGRFSTVDLRAILTEIKDSVLGMRVANVYDIDNKTYLIKLVKTDEKKMLLLESGTRLYATSFDWPKNMMPSGFSMKLRKHLRTRRLISIRQLGSDRIVDMQFGENEAAYHIIVELYDRGNLILTDYEYTILNLLRTRTEGDDVRFAVREKYPLELARPTQPLISLESLREVMVEAKSGDSLKRILNSKLVYGPAVLDHCLLKAGFPEGAKVGKDFDVSQDLPQLMAALVEAEKFLEASGSQTCQGYIVQKREKKPKQDGSPAEELLTYAEFHPFQFKQHDKSPCVEFPSFNKAVDEFFSQLESQRLDLKALQQEKVAIKKLENVKKDHERRLETLQKVQDEDKQKAQLIELNLDLVDKAILVVRSAIANQIDWAEIWDIVKEAQVQGDPVASTIKSLKLDSNHITLLLRNPFSGYESDSEGDDDRAAVGREASSDRPMKIDIDLALSAYANAKKYYDQKRHAAKKEQKTIDASEKAVKNAERKTKETLKDVSTVTKINKARKTYWFEKFLWFITSENYLVVAGRDSQQNELIVKRHLKPGDLYVHADLHGATSCVIQNHASSSVPPKSLNEAGTFAICHSAAWDAKVVTSAWYVHHDQVSKTAPTGEYLTTGSFMIRGKKNYLPPSHLILGFGFIFKVDDSCIWRHKDERKVRMAEEDEESVADSQATEGNPEAEIQDDLKSSSSGTESGDEAGPEDCTEDGTDSGNKVSPEATVEQGTVTVQVVEEETKNTHEEEEEEEDSLFPDTGLTFQHVGGGNPEEAINGINDSEDSNEEEEREDVTEEMERQNGNIENGERFELHRAPSETTEDDMKIYLGDDEMLDLNQLTGNPRHHLSAKQRKELRRKKKQTPHGDDESEDTQYFADRSGQEENQTPLQERPVDNVDQTLRDSQPQDIQPKRGQKAKQKKMRKKYKDQDEEERQMRMELLRSEGNPEKEDKKKKGKKNKQKEQQQRPQSAQQKKQGKGGQAAHAFKDSMVIHEDDATVPIQAHVQEGEVAKDEPESDEEKDAVLAGENIKLVEASSVLDTLTGCPHPEDILLFAIPVCAPYSAMNNFKYKVKLVPGSNKKGKVAKTALGMFTFSKETSSMEKDLFKSVKDADLSRGIPGKVKMSAANLNQLKKKR